MPIFYYKAKKITGETSEGQQEAADRYHLAAELRARGFVLLSSRESKPSRAWWVSFTAILGHVSLQEKMIFARNLSVMAGAGVSIMRSLEVLSRDTASKPFSRALTDIAEGIRKGQTLSEAMGAFPAIFSELFRAMVRAGETSGRLDESLKLLAVQLERDYDLVRKVRGALMYPAIILIAMVAIGILMLIYVVPTLVQTFTELNVELPASTRLVIAVSSFFLNHGIVASLLALLTVALGAAAAVSVTGRRWFGMAIVRLPLVSGVARKINTARTCRTLSSLIRSGVEILEALNVTISVVQNARFQKVLVEAREEIQKGKPVSSAFLAHHNAYPLVVGEMIGVGEETGKLSEMLERLATFFEEEVAEETKSLATIIEPIMMLVIGSIVGFFAISMIQPLYSITGGI